jgi:hypothetical protein
MAEFMDLPLMDTSRRFIQCSTAMTIAQSMFWFVLPVLGKKDHVKLLDNAR